MTELRPCPFCGGGAYVSELRDGMWRAICKSCYTSGNNYMTEVEAVTAWNTRTERTCRNEDYDHDTWFKCSECRIRTNLEIMHGGYAIPNYCPNCGAKVKKRAGDAE